MLTNKNFRAVLLGCAAVALLGACSGADGVASPGVGAFVPPPSSPPPPPPPPPAPPPPTGGPAADCPAGFSNVGVLADNRICQLPTTISGNLVVPQRDGTIYSVAGRTQVGTDLGPDPANPIAGRTSGILTIEPGVTIFGNSGADYLLVNRGSQIFAEGEANNPIIMTSRANIEGNATENSIGQWGGLVINGRAPSTDGCGGAVTPPNIACEAQVEGSNAFYGGNSPSDNSGRIRYLRLSYSGFEIAPNNELNGITLAGVGNGTTFEYVQVHNSSDDGIEIFGGNVNIRYIVLTGIDDDSFDTDSGWRGAAQFGIVVQRQGGGDFAWETSSRGTNTADFFTRPTYANWTIVMRDNSTRDAIVHNSGHTARVYNSVIRHAGNHQCVNIATNATLNNPNGVEGNGPLYRSVFFSCAGGNGDGGASGSTPAADIPDSTIEALLTHPSNVLNGTSTLTGGFINGANENAVAVSAYPTSLNAGTGLGTSNTFITGFLTPVTYIGAVRDSSDTWYQGWTCSLPGQATCH
jgi:hypothetical protein